MKTQRWTKRSRKNDVNNATFMGCALALQGVDFNRYPVSFQFVTVAGPRSTEDVVFQMSFDEAEHVHKALGEMIELRRKQFAVGGVFAERS